MADHDKTTPAPAQTRSDRLRNPSAPRSTRSFSVPNACAADRGRPARPADFRARRDHEPATDVGYRLTLQAEMFREAGSIGGLDVQLVYFRGLNECRASRGSRTAPASAT